MNGAACLLALATLGVDYGWRLDQRGQLEYIIQIPPSQLQTLQESPEGIVSNIPPELVRHVKRFRIVVGSETLPQDPLPAFANESELSSNVTPIKLGTARVSPVGGDLPLESDGEFESTVTPLETLNAPRNALPGPGRDEAFDAVGDFLPIPPLPRADRIRDVEPLAATTARPSLRRDASSNGSFPPNTSSPDVDDTYNTSSTVGLANVGPALPRRNLTPAWGGTTYTDGKQPPYGPLLLTVIGLCLSIGGNVYLGWVAWGYYMKYRESFESWRSSQA